MPDHLEATVVSTNQKMGFSGVTRDNDPITIDYSPPLGDGQGYTPLELQLLSLAACSGSTVATLLRRMRKEVIRLTVTARGTRREEHPLCFQEIVLEFVLESPDAGDAEVSKAIQVSEETYCPVWAMLKGSVQVTTSYQIVAG